MHIKELIDLTEKIPLDQLSDFIQKNKNMLEELEQQLKNATVELKDTQAKLDNAFSKYNSSVSEIRWTYRLKSELKDRGLEFHSISDFVNTVEDLYTLGFDAKKIVLGNR